jgi:hypothetical protein
VNKPTSHFKLTATTKYLLSTITNDHDRHVFRQNMIQAQLESEKKPVKEDKKK